MEISTVVIDNGGYAVQAGLGGEAEPSVVLQSLIGRSKPDAPAGLADVFVGAEVLANQDNLVMKCPIENRVIMNFDEMSKIWSRIFTEELRVNPEEHPVLITESSQNTKTARERSIQIMMETYKVPAYYTTVPSILSLYSAGLTSGCVIDAGESVTHVLPVYECYAMSHAQERLDVGGRQITGFLKKLLLQTGIDMEPKSERDILRDIKERLCYVATDLDTELQKIEHANEIERTFEMPGGRSVKLAAQRFRCPEPMFDPQLIPVQSPGLSQLVAKAISKTEDLQDMMYGNVVLTGGTSMFDGFAARLEREIGTMLPDGAKLNVLAPGNRNTAAWVGGSVLVSLATFSQMWVTKAEYDETGPVVVHLKCF